MPKEFLFSTIYNLCAKELPGKGFQFFDQCYLSTNEELLKDCFPRRALISIGGCECDAAFREGVFAYHELPAGFLAKDDAMATLAVELWLKVIRAFFIALWFVRDNAVANAVHAELTDMQVQFAESVGRTQASVFPIMKSVYTTPGAYEKYVRQSLAMQASMMGCRTKEDILAFVTIAENALNEQAAVLAEVEKENP